MAPHIVWLWACLAHRLLGGVHVSRSEWTERWRMGPLGTAPHGGINVYCCSAPSEGRQWGITSALWPNMAAISMSCLSAVWLVFLRPGPSVLLWVSVILCLICLSGRLSVCPCLPYSGLFVANFSRPASYSMQDHFNPFFPSLFLALSSLRSPSLFFRSNLKNCIMTSLTLFQLMHMFLYLCTITTTRVKRNSFNV